MKYNKIVIALTFTITTFFITSAQAQEKAPTGRLTGSVLDENLKEPIPYVTVAVRESRENDVLTGQLTDSQGKFELRDLPVGKLIVAFQFIGYEAVWQEVTIRENRTIDLGTLFMREDVALLESVEITAERSTVEQKIDRKVIHIGKDLSTIGATAADLMVNIPSVDVDQDGNLSMRGNENVRILIDGKPTNLDAAQLLQQIPSSTIQKIELITNPSAKFNPEGMSGIINVVLHKNTNLGFNGNVSSGVTSGQETRFNGSVDLNYRTKKVNFFGTYGNNLGKSPVAGSVFRPEDASGEQWESYRDRRSHLYKVGVDYFLTDRTTFSGYAIRNTFENELWRATDIAYPEDRRLDFGQQYQSEQANTTTTTNFDIRHQLSKGHTMELEVDYNAFQQEEMADFRFTGERIPTEAAAETLTTDRDHTTINLDYTYPLAVGRKLEMGGEVRLQNTENGYLTTHPGFRDARYSFDRDIYSWYATYGQGLGRWSYQIGARLEHFETDGVLVQPEVEAQRFRDQIFSVYPSAFLTYVPDPEKRRDTYSLNVSRRVDRPNLTQINPIRAWSSARVTNIGNPALIPQFTNSVEINYTRQLKEGSITTGTFYRRIFDEITRFGFNDPQNPENVWFSYNNYENNSAYGFEVSGNYALASWWSFTTSFDLYAQTQRGVVQDELRSVRNVLYNFRMNHSFKANKRLTFQLVSLYRGANTNLQYKTLAFYFVNVGARYSILKGKGTLSLNFNDLFHTQQFSFEAERPVMQIGAFSWDSQTVFAGFSYRFGNKGSQALKRKKRDARETKNSGGF
ncbi:MAG: TonB-dependent receptor [Bacteroidota bacterium]